MREVVCICDGATANVTLLWPELYVDHVPCANCQRLQIGDDEVYGMLRPKLFRERTGDDEFDA